jgi:hypothetical protein
MKQDNCSQTRLNETIKELQEQEGKKSDAYHVPLLPASA